MVALHLVAGLYAQTPTPAKIPQCPDQLVPEPQHKAQPKYPTHALRAGTAATVELRATVDPTGRTKDLAIVKGDAEFVRAAVEAVRRWHFVAITMQGQAVETIYKVRIRFNPLLREVLSDIELESPGAASLISPELLQAHGETWGGEPIFRSSDAGLVKPRIIYQVDPEFSERARKAQESGDVTVSLLVGVDGIPRDIRVACSSAPDLSEKAVEAVTKWRFAPGTREGKPVVVEIAVGVEFHLYK